MSRLSIKNIKAGAIYIVNTEDTTFCEEFDGCILKVESIEDMTVYCTIEKPNSIIKLDYRSELGFKRSVWEAEEYTEENDNDDTIDGYLPFLLYKKVKSKPITYRQLMKVIKENKNAVV